jgi:tetratricopeptide (TPR) repeat protein
MSQTMPPSPPSLEPPPLEDEGGGCADAAIADLSLSASPPPINNVLNPMSLNKQKGGGATVPPISRSSINGPVKVHDSNDETPSLRDEMLKVAQQARAQKEAEARKQRRKKDEQFGQGLGEQMRRNLAKREAKVAKAAQAKADGNEAFKAQDWNRAVEFYTAAIELDGSNAVLYSNRSAAYLKLNKYDEALLDGRRTMQLDPLMPKGYVRTATSLVRLGKPKQASACLRGALSDERGLTNASKRALEKQWAILVEDDYQLYTKEKQMPTLTAAGGPGNQGK